METVVEHVPHDNNDNDNNQQFVCELIKRYLLLFKREAVVMLVLLLKVCEVEPIVSFLVVLKVLKSRQIN